MKTFKPSAITMALLTSGLVFTSYPLLAQDSAQNSDQGKQEEAIERIEVRGFSSSLIQSLNQKRFGDTVSEQLSADDLGGLPDVSMADALTRLPGISAVRTGGQAAEINIRGLSGDFVFSTLNAGLAMGTMDIVNLHGGSPANFLDVGGGATKERVAEAFKIILSDDNVKAVLVNIFGGIVRCDMIAEGIIGAVKEVGVEVPVVVRLEGTNAELGREVLGNSGLDIIAAESLTDAAEKVVAAAEGK